MKYVFIALAIAVILAFILRSLSTAPNSVVYTNSDGTKTTDITQVTESAKFTMADSGVIPKEAETLHQEGRRLGSQRNYDVALEKFKRASAIAPKWAYPLYDAAFTLQLQGKDTDALMTYKQVDALEPEGFFTTKTAIWALEREASGKIPAGTYLKYLMLEDISNRKYRSEAAKELWTKIPDFIPALKEYAISVENDEEKITLIEKGLAMNPDPETKGVLLINKATSLHGLGKKEDARKILTQLAQDKTETLFTRTSAGEVLKVIDR